MLAYFGITVSMCQQCWYKELTISKCNRRYIELSQATYQSAKDGWWDFGTGTFYGSDTIKTVNIKISKSKKQRVIRIEK